MRRDTFRAVPLGFIIISAAFPCIGMAQDSLDFLLDDDEQAQSPPPLQESESSGVAPTGAEEGGTDTDASGVSAASAAEGVETIPVGQADDGDAAYEAPARTKNRFIEEIVVTAQKREENLNDVPISVSAFSGDQLDARGVQTPKDLQLEVPGLQYNIVAGYSLIYIRGVGTGAFIPSADPSVATYIDNVYYPFAHGLASALGSVERIEVLKGPQGTLFGRNSTGGAINILTKDPVPEWKSSVQVDFGNYNRKNVRADVNIPVIDSLALSLAGLRYEEDSYYTLSEDSPNDSLEKDESLGYKAKLKWSPTDNLSGLLSYSYINTQGSTALLFPAKDPKPLGVLLGVTESPDYVTSVDADPYMDDTAKVLSADLQYATPWFDTRLILADEDIKAPARVDYDGSEQPIGYFEAFGQFADVQTAELQFLSNDDSWGSDWLEWIVGGFYIDSSAGYDPLLFPFFPGLLDYLGNRGDGPIGQLLALITPIIDEATGGVVNAGIPVVFQGILDTKSTSVFFQSTADLTDWMSLTLGGRYQTEKRSLATSKVGLALNPNDPYQITPLLDFGQQSQKTSNFSPKVVLDFHLFNDDLLYLSYAKGFKSGTYNVIALIQASDFVEPEEVTAYELGYKGKLFDGVLNYSAALFQSEIKDQQVQIISLTSGGAARFENAGTARIRGAELDVTWQLFPNWLPGLVLTAAGTYLDGVYTDYDNASGFGPTTGIYRNNAYDYTGNDTENSPEFSGNAGLSYSFDVGPGTVEVAASVYHNSGFYFVAQNTESSKEDAYDVVNARASYLYDPWNLRVTVYGNNINDAKYHTSINEYDFQTAALLAQPASYGLRLNWSY
ncbi:MAG: TonB-dependent receptor [Pseudomonadota bacterium]|nr:TonB-dependent receptor [Pseudomonadota bacterium]